MSGEGAPREERQAERSRRKRTVLHDEQVRRFRRIFEQIPKANDPPSWDAIVDEFLLLASEANARRLVRHGLRELINLAVDGNAVLRERLEYTFSLPLDEIQHLRSPLETLELFAEEAERRRKSEEGIAATEQPHALYERLVTIRELLRQGNPTMAESLPSEIDGMEVEPGYHIVNSQAEELWHERAEGLGALEAELLGESLIERMLAEATHGLVKDDGVLAWVPRPYDPTHRARLVARAAWRVQELLDAMELARPVLVPPAASPPAPAPPQQPSNGHKEPPPKGKCVVEKVAAAVVKVTEGGTIATVRGPKQTWLLLAVYEKAGEHLRWEDLVRADIDNAGVILAARLERSRGRGRARQPATPKMATQIQTLMTTGNRICRALGKLDYHWQQDGAGVVWSPDCQ